MKRKISLLGYFGPNRRKGAGRQFCDELIQLAAEPLKGWNISKRKVLHAQSFAASPGRISISTATADSREMSLDLPDVAVQPTAASLHQD